MKEELLKNLFGPFLNPKTITLKPISEEDDIYIKDVITKNNIQQEPALTGYIDNIAFKVFFDNNQIIIVTKNAIIKYLSDATTRFNGTITKYQKNKTIIFSNTSLKIIATNNNANIFIEEKIQKSNNNQYPIITEKIYTIEQYDINFACRKYWKTTPQNIEAPIIVGTIKIQGKESVFNFINENGIYIKGKESQFNTLQQLKSAIKPIGNMSIEPSTTFLTLINTHLEKPKFLKLLEHEALKQYEHNAINTNGYSLTLEIKVD